MWRNGSCFNVVMTTHIWGFCGSNPGFVAWIQTKAFQKNQPRLSPNCSEPERLASNGSRWNQENTVAKDLKTQQTFAKKNSRSSPLCKCTIRAPRPNHQMAPPSSRRLRCIPGHGPLLLFVSGLDSQRLGWKNDGLNHKKNYHPQVANTIICRQMGLWRTYRLPRNSHFCSFSAYSCWVNLHRKLKLPWFWWNPPNVQKRPRENKSHILSW